MKWPEFFTADTFREAARESDRALEGLRKAREHRDGVMWELHLKDSDRALNRLQSLTTVASPWLRTFGVGLIALDLVLVAANLFWAFEDDSWINLVAAALIALLGLFQFRITLRQYRAFKNDPGRGG